MTRFDLLGFDEAGESGGRGEMSADGRIEQARLLYERAVFGATPRL